MQQWYRVWCFTFWELQLPSTRVKPEKRSAYEDLSRFGILFLLGPPTWEALLPSDASFEGGLHHSKQKLYKDWMCIHGPPAGPLHIVLNPPKEGYIHLLKPKSETPPFARVSKRRPSGTPRINGLQGDAKHPCQDSIRTF